MSVKILQNSEKWLFGCINKLKMSQMSSSAPTKLWLTPAVVVSFWQEYLTTEQAGTKHNGELYDLDTTQKHITFFWRGVGVLQTETPAVIPGLSSLHTAENPPPLTGC